MDARNPAKSRTAAYLVNGVRASTSATMISIAPDLTPGVAMQYGSTNLVNVETRAGLKTKPSRASSLRRCSPIVAVGTISTAGVAASRAEPRAVGPGRRWFCRTPAGQESIAWGLAQYTCSEPTLTERSRPAYCLLELRVRRSEAHHAPHRGAAHRQETRRSWAGRDRSAD